ncbi:sporozoite-associated mosquito saliva protein 1 [Rhynchophorus ferrugineus]|uniref:MD-2-related lipid-recognition domain-containing protein n=1 Tax=Rhynchophorus ferrugineus TaxID=354439 RepID=A0A834ML62_RHYFE|nr:hypothetical protein GWI33_000226 [Rhynchophorus ferrugineus]
MKYLVPLYFLAALQSCAACNGWTAKITSYKTCVNNSVIQLPSDGLEVLLDKDCNVYLKGCVEITKDYKTAKGAYLLRKPPLPELDGEMDFCSLDKKLKNIPDAMKALELLGVPTHCPVKAGKICGSPSKKISVMKYKNQLGMAAGNSEVKVEIDHDVGKSCYELSFNVNRAKKG